MSELKTYEMVDEKYCTDCICVIPSEVYLKSEADKVIVEQTTLRAWAEMQLRHNKYKRCLAMSRWCDALMAFFGEFYDDASKQMVTHYYKWRKRWLELAEKFKEAK